MASDRQATTQRSRRFRPVPLTPQEREETLNERDRIERRGRIRQFVFGSLDGLLVPLGVVSGVAGGTGSTKAVIVAGLAEAFAGALSMGAGEFLSGRAEAQVQLAEIKNELRHIRRDPELEMGELIAILENEGVRHDDAQIIAERLGVYPAAFSKTMVQKELGLDVEVETVRIREGLTMGLSYAAASIVPLIAYFFLPLTDAFFVSIGLTFVVLAGIGIIRGKLAQLNLWKSALEVIAVGTVSGLGGYLLGIWLPKLFGY